MKTIEATVEDATHLRLLAAIDLPRGARVAVALFPGREWQGNEGKAWSALSAKGLAAAYGDDEPEYSSDMLIAEDGGPTP